MLIGIALVLAGLIAAGPELVRHKPEMGDFLEKLGAWQGLIGGALLIGGTLNLVFSVLPALFVGTAIAALFKIVGATVTLGLGLSLGSQNIKRLPVPQLQTTEIASRLDSLTVRAQKFNVPLGTLALLFGLKALIIG